MDILFGFIIGGFLVFTIMACWSDYEVGLKTYRIEQLERRIVRLNTKYQIVRNELNKRQTCRKPKY